MPSPARRSARWPTLVATLFSIWWPLHSGAADPAAPPQGHNPRWSPDGKQVAALCSGMGSQGLVVWEPTTGQSRFIALPSAPTLAPLWLGGDRIAVPSREAGGEPDGRVAAVYVADLSNGEVRRAAGAGEHGIAQMAASPDGTQIVVSGSKFVYDAGKVRMPDGRTAAEWGAKSVGGDQGMWMVDVASARSVPLAQQDGACDVAASFSPDGDTLLFTRMTGVSPSGDPAPKRNLAALDPKTGQTTMLTADDLSHTASWSPDGSRIAYFRVGDDPELWVMDRNGGNAHAVKTGPIARPDPCAPAWWRPDGRYLVYHSQGQLFAVPAEGVGLHRISGDLRVEDRYGFAISPDGKRVVYGERAAETGPMGGAPVLRVGELQWPDGAWQGNRGG